MKVIDTSTFVERELNPDERHWVYNAFDVLLPHDIREAVYSRMNPNQRAFYEFERSLQGPALSMMLYGVLVDPVALATQTKRAQKEYETIEKYVRSLSIAVWGEGINPRSHGQMKDLFYYNRYGFQLKPKYNGSGQRRTVTTDRNALEKIISEEPDTVPIITAILDQKDLDSELQFLRRGVEEDGRVHYSFNITGTETGRWSSSNNPWSRGANFQNQAEKTRAIYVADKGWIFAYPDLPQAESRAVAYYSGDESYISAVESGDLHTTVAEIIWPDLGWTEDARANRDLADQGFYREFSRRDMSKRGGHASNYYGKPWTIAQALKVRQSIIEDFQRDYFARFPGIPRWHRDVQVLLQADGKLTTPLGRERTFFGRLDSDETLKEALAFLPQSLISDIIKIGALRVWRDPELQPHVKLCADMHDGLLMLIRESKLDELVPKIKRHLTVPIKMPHGTMVMPPDFTVGYRWQKKEMKEWKPGITSELTRPSQIDSLLDMDASLI